MANLKIVELNINEITPYSKNAKKHPKKQIEQLINSIEEFKFCDPIGVWGENNIIVEGHGRYEACKKLGLKKIPCIRLDHLTDEQRRAYTLTHNKSAEGSEWDYDFLDEEISALADFDFEDFGFDDFEIVKTEEEKHEEFKETTQKRVENILNLGLAQFNGVGKYDIPEILPVYEIPEVKEWIGFNYVLTDKEPKGKGVHFFLDDYQFERVWNNPDAYVDKLKNYAVVAAPDFSPYGDMPLATQIFNHYRKHWVAAYLQSKGVKVIPTIRASTDERSLDFYLEGEPKGGIVAISSMWATKSKELRDYFIKEYNRMYDELQPYKVFVYGKEIEGLKGNVEYISSFAAKRWKNEPSEY